MKLFPAIFLGLTLTFAVSPQVKKAATPETKPQFSSSLQVIVVTGEPNSIRATARLFERKAPTSSWTPYGTSFPVVLGMKGLARDETVDWGGNDPSTPLKREGDMRSPAGLFPLTSSFGTSAKSDALTLPYTKLGEFTECVDDVRSSFYNQIVDRMQVGNFDWKSSEKMLSIVPQYELGIFVGYNSFPVRRGNGSCIFLHIWKNADSGTAGCTAMERRDLERIAIWLDPKNSPYLVQLTNKDYSKYRKTWNLPKL